MGCNPAMMVDPLGLMGSMVTDLPAIEVIAHRWTQNVGGNFVANGAAFLFEGSAWNAESRSPFDETEDLLDRALEQTTGGGQSSEGHDQDPQSKKKTDPLGLAIVANVSDAVYGKGHSGLLVQKQDGTWQFISKEGRDEDGDGSSNNALSGGPALKAVDVNYKTLSDFFADKNQSRYNRFAMVIISDVNKVETTMRQAANSKYNLICANCGTAVNNTLEVGGVKVGYYITPNSQFSAITSRNVIYWYYER
ncbi:MAG: hypothetical protein BGO31_16740 [Bacteroidetes bacterium 43-16]|nr:MAG: hypothetical protein BGO31_16740 [Bacteroidetes bacterium 43-16]